MNFWSGKMDDDISFEHEDRKQQGRTKRTIEDVHDDIEESNEQAKKIKSENIGNVNDVILTESMTCDGIENEKSGDVDIEKRDVEEKKESVQVHCLS